jgi:beta-mannosidase
MQAGSASLTPLLLFLITAVATGNSGWNSPALDSLPTPDLLDLGGESWTVHASAGPGAANCSAKVKASVPGDIYTDLHAAATIGDPLGAFGDWKTAWAGRTSWVYGRTFGVTAAQLGASGSALLVFEGIETNATVKLNGKHILTADDSWVDYTVSVHELLTAGTNTLEVAFTSVYDACEFSDPFHSNVTCTGRVYVRQAASSWGWDWAKRYSPQGIWRPTYVAFIPKASAAVTSLDAIVRPAPGEPALAKKFLVGLSAPARGV